MPTLNRKSWWAKFWPRTASYYTALTVELLEPRAMLAATPELLFDINRQPAGVGVDGPIVEVGGVAFFAGEDLFHGTELWRTDGTADGTTLVKDIVPGARSSRPSALTNINGTLFFAAVDQSDGFEVWKSDGTEQGTVLVKHFLPGAGDFFYSLPTTDFINVNGTLFFTVNEGAQDHELWKCDGTSAGTILVKNFTAQPRQLTNVNETLFFTAADNADGSELWRSDGTEMGTTLVKDIFLGPRSSSPSNLINAGGELFFTANDDTSGYELWKSDGSEAGTVLVADLSENNPGSIPRSLTEVNGAVRFVANQNELWASDGTLAGTRLLRSFADSQHPFSEPRHLSNANGTLLFFVEETLGAHDLWKSDGTPQGTVLATDINFKLRRDFPSGFPATTVNGATFFGANDGIHGYELWRTDGTAGGTLMLKDISSGQFSSYPFAFANVNGTLFFEANGELWKSDGTAGGTVLSPLSDPQTGSSGFFQQGRSDQRLAIVDQTLFFTAFDGLHGDELWKSDGTPAGTALVKDIKPGPASAGIFSMINVNKTLFFVADDGISGYELWKSDGTEAGTVLVKDIQPGPGSSLRFPIVFPTDPSNFVNVSGTLFFFADDGEHGFELWKSDGTEGGTQIVKDIFPGPIGALKEIGLVRTDLENVNGTLFFAADEGVGNIELWRSDGTDAGTTAVTDISQGLMITLPTEIVNVNGTTFFSTTLLGPFERSLWKTDGTTEGTILLKSFIPITSPYDGAIRYLTNISGMLFFRTFDEENGTELWKSDGTPSGTVLVKDLSPGDSSSFPTALTNVNGTLFFAPFGGDLDGQLWKSDGTAEGTVLVRDIGRVVGDDDLENATYNLVNVNGTLFFSADDGVHGHELWISDGTFAGTVQLPDIAPGDAQSYPNSLVSVGGRLFFIANDGINGYELWTVAPQGPPFDVVNDVEQPQTPDQSGEDSSRDSGTSQAGEPRSAFSFVSRQTSAAIVTGGIGESPSKDAESADSSDDAPAPALSATHRGKPEIQIALAELSDVEQEQLVDIDPGEELNKPKHEPTNGNGGNHQGCTPPTPPDPDSPSFWQWLLSTWHWIAAAVVGATSPPVLFYVWRRRTIRRS